ncbi:tRNA epoxyqueuosine(34) reductase QueG [Polymorphobacter fuscus]|uniref:Epoxyqueuosine reductase n=1 Tax=Sandarakinorhabdus fusca TaxID=1439888 RepID=A0A7C9GZ84_9SPHN|nr:tRNA epoxyqueuosine(34) reductase QueG [Polymorphobacter fuscus]KAB7644060.1 tRNA epoxyqueuosine(34) reductase QueG [Polymorphobacter fuscus]MQT18434.1 tRNA epoxyqueuosine(34) reductase QueG [Polymorphobacter fuscus]NJC08446.1 epoxyqueuosine reductase [Polymorphobacter fuscus]
MTDNAALRLGLAAEAERLGFAAFGIAPADAAPLAGARLRQWLADGCHGDMHWMAETVDRRASTTGLWPEVRSVVMLGTRYAPGLDPLRHAAHPETGVISIYALGSDYHDAIKKRLKALARWLVAAVPDQPLKVFVDTAPVMEKPLAAAAGLGWQGKHTNLVSRSEGSWLFLGALMTTIALPVDAPHKDHCGSCDRCQQACPTGAFPAPYRLDARRCISYLTIEHKGPVPDEFRAAMGNRIYGCDDCLAACPWNRFARAARDMAFRPRAELVAPRLADLLLLDDAGFRQLFSGSPIKRIGRDRMVRNCLYAAGSSGNAGLLPQVLALCGDADAGVADAAAWAAARLSAPQPSALTASAIST